MTAQLHEVLILDGEKLSMAFCPSLPLGDPRLRELSYKEIDARRRRAHDEPVAAGRTDELSLLDEIG